MTLDCVASTIEIVCLANTNTEFGKNFENEYIFFLYLDLKRFQNRFEAFGRITLMTTSYAKIAMSNSIQGTLGNLGFLIWYVETKHNVLAPWDRI